MFARLGVTIDDRTASYNGRAITSAKELLAVESVATAIAPYAAELEQIGCILRNHLDVYDGGIVLTYDHAGVTFLCFRIFIGNDDITIGATPYVDAYELEEYWPGRLDNMDAALRQFLRDSHACAVRVRGIEAEIEAKLKPLRAEIEALRAENIELRYRPGGPGAEAAAEHFAELAKN